MQDNDGKAPIHHLCQSFMLNYQDTSLLSGKESMMCIVDMLKRVAPKSFNLEDNNEMNAIEYAIESNTDIRIIKAIQRACRDDWRERKEESDAPHEALQEDLHRIQMDLRSQHLSSLGSNFMKHYGESTGVPITGQLAFKVQAARMA